MRRRDVEGYRHGRFAAWRVWTLPDVCAIAYPHISDPDGP